MTITIKNQGEEAYKPKEYGKSIIISRTFTTSGSSTWKIMNSQGKGVSTKRDELSAICDHMNIQVDNPMTVLTQGMIHSFLPSWPRPNPLVPRLVPAPDPFAQELRYMQPSTPELRYTC